MYDKYDRRWVSNKAVEFGLIISDNEIKIQQIITGLNKTDGNCPCTPKYLYNEDTICPCLPVREGMVCHCGLFERPIDNPDK